MPTGAFNIFPSLSLADVAPDVENRVKFLT